MLDSEQQKFLEVLLATSIARQQVLKCDAALWRAQLGRDVEFSIPGIEEFVPFSIDRMKPLSDRASEGRANPKGIPYLYLATQQDTAVAEVRPWIGSYVSVGQFVLTHDLRVVNCITDDRSIIVYSEEPEPAERQRAVWQAVDRAFSQPVTPSDDTADYAPTQIISEFFRANGLDGIAYGSSLGLGHNVALFELDAARLVSCELRQICGVKFDSSLAGNPYRVRRVAHPSRKV